MNEHPKSPALTTRLMGLAIAVVGLSGAAVLFGAYVYGRAAADRAYDQLMRGAILQISERLYVKDGTLQVDLPPSAFSLLGLAEGDHIFYKITDETGANLSGYPELDAEITVGQINTQNGSFLGFEVRKMSYGRAFVEESYTGQGHVVIAQTKEARRALAIEITMRAFWGLGLLGTVLIALLLFSIYWSMRPLHALERELLARDPLDFSPLRTEMPREMATFSKSMNHFLSSLKRRVDSMQKIIADSTHQIRTPIAALRAQADLPINYNDIDDVRENKERIQTQARALSRLTEQLLTQALVTHRADTVKMVDIDLRRVAIDAEKHLHAARLWPDNVIHLNLCNEPAIVKGDAFSLREAVKNLITNALEYGKPPVNIDVTARAIHIIDFGDGFDPHQMAQGNGKDSGQSYGQGYGRGLEIVRDVVEFHGGKLTFTKRNAGFCVSIEFGEAP